jgi:aromatic-L-amino-acid decarboxylase
MDADQFRKAGYELVDFLANYYTNTLQTEKVRNPNLQYNDIRKLLPSKAPQEPESWEKIRKDIDTIIMPHLTHWHSPNFFGFFSCEWFISINFG